MHADDIAGEILEAAIVVHRELGPGLMESVYETVLAHELTTRGLHVRRQQPVRLEHQGRVFPEAFRVDILVENTVVIELKSVARIEPVFVRQLLTYLRLMKLPVGLILNFGCLTMMAGTRRVVNNAPPQANSRVRVNTISHEQNSA